MLVLVFGGLGLYWRQQASSPSPPAAVAPAPSAPLRAGGLAPSAVAVPPVAAAAGSDARLAAESRLQRARETLSQYVRATRYPPESRPLREHPDRNHPFIPVGRTLPLPLRDRRNGAVDTDLSVRLVQDRVQLGGDDSARLEVRCEDSLGAAVPCLISDATAAVPPPLGDGRRPPVPVDFSDDGHGSHIAIFQPAGQGFRGFTGPLRVAFTVQVGSGAAPLFFDLAYTGEAPARFTGRFREAVEGGSLRLYVGLEVARPGRYIITSRVDDARDRPLAYLEHNGELAAGPQELPLTVFGLLLRDESPDWPLKLRDLEGFLLFEDRDPDRMQLGPLPGVVYTSARHSLGEFSAEEWQSEERDRHVRELEKDVSEAQAEVDHLPH